MVLTNFFLRKKTSTTASIAKKRLHIIVTERKIDNTPELNYLPKFKKDLLRIIHQYIHEPKKISIQLQEQDNNAYMLQLTISFLTKNQDLINSKKQDNTTV
ncbi:cell division topological specificity factor [Candidatus Blochmanniella floridana]|uniref:Cell division topological specificity factor n=1 Tax=Blochmanniella floridana TaxID=203907 RepID=MINE_BLOFL|nr:RecName: Full=Cell division topological specificity factor [Candidatus Blochmannia floridanus]CAD83503.1 cell division topological specificity factor [Candidatus Blochmannia floridanus]